MTVLLSTDTAPTSHQAPKSWELVTTLCVFGSPSRGLVRDRASTFFQIIFKFSRHHNLDKRNEFITRTTQPSIKVEDHTRRIPEAPTMMNWRKKRILSTNVGGGGGDSHFHTNLQRAGPLCARDGYRLNWKAGSLFYRRKWWRWWDASFGGGGMLLSRMCIDYVSGECDEMDSFFFSFDEHDLTEIYGGCSLRIIVQLDYDNY